ncbi:MAG TPA: ribosomal protein S18-alanine N-acetyltransferase [Gemmatimonadaceae bacterium]|nr:ribosomal protein S18-alanine N-acetyltransferase [Gemmatimonadaceae bacterium]
MIRHATAEDLGRIGDIEQVSFTDPWSRQSFRALLGDDRVLFAVANVAPREVVGYVVTWFVSDEAEIANLAVAPEGRRHGVGAALLDAALVEARRRGVRQVYLEVRESNIAARALYERRGFSVMGRRRKYYRHPEEDALVLRREIATEVRK